MGSGYERGGWFTKDVPLSKSGAVYERRTSFQIQPCLRNKCFFLKADLFTKEMFLSKGGPVYERNVSF